MNRLHSLGAKITAGVLVLIAGIFTANFVVNSFIASSVSEETTTMVETMRGALDKKAATVEQLLATKLNVVNEKLQAIHKVEEIEAQSAFKSATGFISGQRAGIALTTQTQIESAMMAGDASIVAALIETLLETDEIKAINVWRPSGELAFRDNKTINQINELFGAEAFEKRDPEDPILIDGERKKTMDEAVAKMESGLTYNGTLANGDDPSKQSAVQFSYYVMDNREDCHGCHGEGPGARGVLEIGLSRDAVVKLEAEAEAHLQVLEKQQKLQAEEVLAENKAEIQRSKKEIEEATQKVQQTMDELDDTQSWAKWVQVATSIAFFIATIALLLPILGKLLSGPLNRMSTAMHKLADGDLEVEIPGTMRNDEIGKMASAVQVFKDNAIKMDEMNKSQADTDRRMAAERKATLNRMADDFQKSVGSVVDNVMTSAQRMESSAQQMTSAAEQASSEAAEINSSSGQASENVQTVAAAAEELTTSISEISSQVSQSSKIAGEAVEQATSTNAKIESLAEAAHKIGEVVALITDIADQTNLLALNATIEAARAGEAGKGFAVVASEVKNLANQTARATDEIGGHITSMQHATDDAVDAIRGIGETIASMNEIASTIAAAVEEQGSATKEIARNVDQAARSTSEVSSSVGHVTESAGNTRENASHVLEAARDLNHQSETLRGQVDKFLDEIRHG